MALTYTDPHPVELAQTGVAVGLTPAIDATTGLAITAPIEIQRAPDSSGSPNVGSAVTVANPPMVTPSGVLYLDPLPLTANRYWYRFRHVQGAGVGTWSAWLGPFEAVEVLKEVLAAARSGPALTVTNDPAWTQTQARPGTHTQQMLPNFGFEDGLVFWVQNTGNTCRVLTDSTKAHAGNRYLEVTSTTGVRSNAVAADDAGRKRWFEVSPGDVVQWGGWVYRESGTDNCQVLLQTADKDQASVLNYVAGPNNTAGWVLVQSQLVIPAGIKYVTVFCDVEGNGTATVARFDDVFLRILLQRTLPRSDGIYDLRATETDGSTKKSDAHNPQGSLLPLAVDSIFTTQTAFPAGRTPWIGVTWPARTMQRPDGSTFSLPASSWTTAGPGGALPAAPTLTDLGATGALAATTYFFRIGYVKNGWIVSIGAEASITVAVNHAIRVTGPAAPVNNWYDGFVVLIGTAANAEAMESAVGGSGIAPKAFGTNVDYTAVGSLRGGAYSDCTSGSLLALDSNGTTLGGSTDYYVHPYIDPGSPSGYVLMAGNPQTVGDALLMTNAAVQWADTHMPLSFGGIKITTLASGGSGGGGSGAGGRLLK